MSNKDGFSTIKLDFSNKKMIKKLNVISKHRAALAKELEEIDKDDIEVMSKM
ncbi:hypothetical protein [Bacillus sp. JJ722]|uniref:hypothetical protein n=1 Tax=Bacillus sp. JJ722 TaxID=3122973 RepID=UPI002FFE5A41